MNSKISTKDNPFSPLTHSSTTVMSRFAATGKKSGIQAVLAVGYFALAVVVNETSGSTGLLTMGFLILTATYVLGRAELLDRDSMGVGAAAKGKS